MAEQVKIVDLNEATSVRENDVHVIDDGVETKKVAQKNLLRGYFGIVIENGYICQE